MPPRRPYVRTLYIISSILLLLWGTWALTNAILYRIIEHTVQHQHRVALSIGAVRWIPLSRSIQLRHVTLRTSEHPPMQLAIHSCTLYGIHHTRQTLWSLDSLVIVRPTITLIRPDTLHPSTTPRSNHSPSVFARHSLSFHIGTIRIVDGTMEQPTASGGIVTRFHSIGAQIGPLSWSSEQGVNDRLTLHEAYGNDPYQAVQWHLRKCTYTLSAGHLHAENLRRTPLYPAIDYTELAPAHSDWLSMLLRRIDLYGLDLPKLLRQRTLQLDSLTVCGGSVNSTKNRNLSQPLRCKPMVYTLLQQSTMPLDIGAMRFDSLTIRYTEIPEGSDSSGTVHFDRLHAECSRIVHPSLGSDSTLTITASALLMGHAPLQAQIELPMVGLMAPFVIRGSAGGATMQRFNPITVPLAHLRIDSGAIDSLHFIVQGDTLRSQTTLHVTYHDLWVTLLRNTPGDTTTDRITTRLADDFLIRHSNPDSSGYRVGRASVWRDPDRSEFHYLWKSLEGALTQVIAHRKDRLARHPHRHW